MNWETVENSDMTTMSRAPVPGGWFVCIADKDNVEFDLDGTTDVPIIDSGSTWLLGSHPYTSFEGVPSALTGKITGTVWHSYGFFYPDPGHEWDGS
jgi:hypothetical protein